jgi:hypothetical protein
MEENKIFGAESKMWAEVLAQRDLTGIAGGGDTWGADDSLGGANTRRLQKAQGAGHPVKLAVEDAPMTAPLWNG